jgi:hypothetical protein
MTRRKVSSTRLQRLTSQVAVHLLADSALGHNILVLLHQGSDHLQWVLVVLCLRLVSAALLLSLLVPDSPQWGPLLFHPTDPLPREEWDHHLPVVSLAVLLHSLQMLPLVVTSLLSHHKMLVLHHPVVLKDPRVDLQSMAQVSTQID